MSVRVEIDFRPGLGWAARALRPRSWEFSLDHLASCEEATERAHQAACAEFGADVATVYSYSKAGLAEACREEAAEPAAGEPGRRRGRELASH